MKFWILIKSEKIIESYFLSLFMGCTLISNSVITSEDEKIQNKADLQLYLHFERMLRKSDFLTDDDIISIDDLFGK